MRNFEPLPLPNPWTNLDAASNISLRPQGIDVQNLIKTDSAVAALRMREKTRFRVGFFCLHIRLSIYPFFATPTRRTFSAILTLNGSYDVFPQPLVPFGGRVNIAPHLGGQIPPKTPILAA